MFSCLICNSRYELEDVKAGLYFVSTGVCLTCYRKLAKSDNTCFGKLYRARALPCKSECPDRVVCRVFTHHPNDSMKER
jgi:hypothetical protein